MVLLRDGFPGERLHVLPRPLVAAARQEPLTERLLVTDAGYFPHAAHHGRIRPRGAEELVVILVSEGAGWVRTVDSPTTLRPGNVLLLPPNTPHSYGADTDDPWSIWWFHAVGADVPALLDSLQQRLGSTHVLATDSTVLVPLFEAVVDAVSRDETRASLIAACGAAWPVLSALNVVAAPSRSRGTHDAITEIRDHLRNHIDQPTDVTELARRAQLSVSHFSAAFRRATGVGVVEYVKRLRMARARFLLEATDQTVTEIAVATGYADAFYFSRQFKKVVGQSPLQFRKASRSSEPVPVLREDRD